MTLQQLEYFVAVFRIRHFAKAAEACGVTQPTLSAMIQKLEKKLGVKLFERSSQQVLPTPIGKMLAEQAHTILAEADRLKAMVDEERNVLSGTFRLGILPTIAPYLLPRLMPYWQRKYPHTKIQVVEMKTNELRQALTDGEVDAAILVKVEPFAEFDCRTLFYEQFLTYISREHPLFARTAIKTADLQTDHLLLLDEGHCFRDQLVRFCHLKAARASQSTYKLGSIETFMRIVESGCGVTFIPELALEQLTAAQKELVRPFAIPIPTREIVMLTVKHFVRQMWLDTLVDAVRRCVPARMLTLNNTEQRL